MSEDLGRPARRMRAVLLPLLIVALATAAVHWPVLSARAESFDDANYLAPDGPVVHPGWDSIKQFFAEIRAPHSIPGYAHPVAMLSLMLDVWLGGNLDQLEPFHRTGLLLHVLNTLIVFGLVRALFGRTWIAAAAALLFGLHPLSVESVAWISQRKSLLAATLGLGSLWLYVTWVQRRRALLLVASLAAYGLAVLSKPSVLAVPVLLVLLDAWPLGRLSWRAVVEKAPFLLLGLIVGYVVVESHAATLGLHVTESPAWWHVPILVCSKLVFCLSKIVWPAELSCYYPPVAASEQFVWEALRSLVPVCLVVVATIVSFRRTRAILLGGLFFLVAISPTLGVVKYSWVFFQDCYTYFPMFGLLLVVAWLLVQAWGPRQLQSESAPPQAESGEQQARRSAWRGAGPSSTGSDGPSSSQAAGVCRPDGRASRAHPSGRYRMAACVAATMAVLAAEAVATRGYLRRWEGREDLYRYMLTLQPDAYVLHNNLGAVLEREGDLGGAVACYRRAMAAKPERADETRTRYNLGRLLARLGEQNEAVEQFVQALRRTPGELVARHDSAVAWAGEGRLREAAALLTAVLRVKPDWSEAHNNLGNVRDESGRAQEAVEHYSEAVRLKPDYADARCNLATALSSLGRYEEAQAEYARVLQLDPNNARGQYRLGDLYFDRGAFASAASHYSEAVRLNPKDGISQSRLGDAYRALGRLTEAAASHERAIQLQPENPDAHFNLGVDCELAGRTDAAMAEYRRTLTLDPRHEGAAERLARLLSASSSRPAG